MASSPAAYRRVIFAYAGVCLIMWTVPLLSILHVESSAIIAAAAFFGAGLSTPAFLRSGTRLRSIVIHQEAALLVPLCLLSVTALWQPNCDYIRGLLFYALFPGITVLFAVSLASFLYRMPIRRFGIWFVGVGVAMVSIPTIYDVGFHPQFYTYNHVFGGFLGPIYDEQLSMRPGLFVFRALTILWSVFLLSAAAWRSADMRRRVVVLGCAVLIACAYAFSARLGFNTTYDRIEAELGGVHRTSEFEIYYDPDYTSDEELRRMVDEHAYRYAQLRQKLGVEVDAPIRSYIYPNPNVKAALTGARYTNVAPVWLSVPQMHLLAESIADVLPHELVHVFSREFGLPVIRASVSVGLVEGLAVALEPPDGRPDPHEQVSAALLARYLPGSAAEPVEDLVDVVASHLSPLGFWTGRGAVSYTTMGSFVSYLIEAYGAEPLLRAYATAAFEKSYGKNPETLAREWTDRVLSLDAVGRSTARMVMASFSVPSLFEKDCPHYMPPHRRRLMEARRYLAQRDSAAAYRAASDAVTLQPAYGPALLLWSDLALRAGDVQAVVDRMSLPQGDPLTPELRMRRGDALALLGRSDEASESYRRAREALPAFAHEAAGSLLLRQSLADEPAAIAMLATDVLPTDVLPTDSGVTGEDPQRIAAALALARDGRYEQAIDLMRTTSQTSLSGAVPDLGGELVRRRLVWLSELSYRSGRTRDAAAYADSAAAAYRDAGAFNEAGRLLDARNKLNWLAERQMDGIARRSEVRDIFPQ